MSPIVRLESHNRQRESRSFAFGGFRRKVSASQPEEVVPALQEVIREVGGGRHAAGYLSYEAASGLDPVLTTRASGALPLVWFGIFDRREEADPEALDSGAAYALSEWKPTTSREDYDRSIQRIRAYIEAGDTYQVNHTIRMEAAFSGDPVSFYRDLCRSQRASYCAYLDLGRHKVLSASPELFFSLEEGVLTTRPMKGTRPRGRWESEDLALADQLRSAEKDRAENLMIVDLLRNDLGRVADTGSVSVPALWEVERYETVWQMTSTVTARLKRGVGTSDILRALFPCGSVTGAPKVRTMEIIAELETSPRGVYTGSIGYISPGPEIAFNVAIRTVWIDTDAGRAEFGVGGGITYDSSESGEYAECMVKARVLTARR
ncbi:MAG: aminodeoxychorismate synthase component I, partial [Candidatus Latescibacteria bacterium]|nr:aminodeoxychorismate synthase component I [Candidatus Latescibacterota bacterium]